MEFIIDEENTNINSNVSNQNNHLNRTIINPSAITSSTPVFLTKEQRNKLHQEDIKNKESEEKNKIVEIKKHLKEYVCRDKSKKRYKSRSRSRSNSRERVINRKNDKVTDITQLQEKEKEEIRVKNFLNFRIAILDCIKISEDL
jgi:hypothetical protein